MAPRPTAAQRGAPHRDLAATFEALLGIAAVAAGADSAALYLSDPEDGTLCLAAIRPPRPAAIGHLVRPGEGLVGRTQAEARSVRSADVRRDPRAVNRRPDWDTAPPVRSFLGVPLRAGSVLVGVLELTSPRRDAFDLEQRVWAAVLGDAAALLVEQARLQAQPPPAALADAPLAGDDPAAVATLDSGLRIADANPAFSRLVGLGPEALLGRPILAVLPALGRPRGRDALEAALHGASGHLGRVPTRTEGGRDVVLGISMVPLGPGRSGAAGVLLVVVDVAARARLEAELREKNARAVEAGDRLREVIEVVSHELRTPLTSVLGYARLLADRPDAEAERRARWAELVIDKARMMARLVDEVTDLARLGSARMPLDRSPTDLAELSRQAASEAVAASDRHRVDVRVEPGVREVRVDRDRIAQVLANLLGNAVKFWPQGGTVVLTVSPDPEGVRIDVEDRGPGVPTEAVKHIFEPFYRAPARAGSALPGTGLGLAVSRGIVEAHGGRLWHEAPAEGGARFRMVLPADESSD